jgi:cytosine/adenosine deaminase-related metal-dependent hydrolase
MYKRGLDVGLGTDGPLSVSKMGILEQIAYAKQAAHSFGDPEDDTPYDWVYMATMGGARVLDKEDEIGSLEVGKKADMIIIDVDTPNMRPQFNPYYQVAFSAYPSNVVTTIVNGKFVVRDGAIQTVDLAKHYAEWEPILEKVQARGLEM